MNGLTFTDVLQMYGDNPLTTFIFIMKHGGLFIVYPFFVKGLIDGWLEWTREYVKHHRKYVLMSVNVPKENEQSMKAIEQIYAQIYGIRRDPTWADKWWRGWTQSLVSFEIESDGGYSQFYIRCLDKQQDVIETAIYAQYPDAEIKTIEKEHEYTNKLNVKMIEDKSYDLYGCEFVLEKHEKFCIRHWRGWEHSLPGKFIDPMAAVLEIMSRMQPGEHMWFQMMSEPIPLEELNHECQEEINKIIGEHKTKLTFFDHLIDFPVKLLTVLADNIFGNPEESSIKEKEGKRIFLVEYEREAVTELDMKRSRWPFRSKIRFIYFAKKEIFNQEKARRGFFGAMKQFKFLNSFLEGKYTKVELKDTYWFDHYYEFFQKIRLFWRKRSLIWNYKAMDMERGETEGYALSCEELASLYHFPQIDVRAPFVQKAESRRVEPPTQLNFSKMEAQMQPGVEVKVAPMKAGEDAALSSPVPPPEGPRPGVIILKQTPEQAAYHEKLQREQGYLPMDNVDGTTAWPEGETPETLAAKQANQQPAAVPVNQNTMPVTNNEPGAPPPNLPFV